MTEHWTFQSAFMPDGEPVPGKTYRADGWAYFDAPRMTPDAWDVLIGRIGEGNFVALALADYGDSKRGQLLISPAGLDALKASMPH